MAEPIFTGGIAMLARPDGDQHQILALDLTVRPQGPHRFVVLPLPIRPDQAPQVEWLESPDHGLFTRLDALFHPLVWVDHEQAAPKSDAPGPRMPPKATVQGGIVRGRDELLQAGLTGLTGETAADAIYLWARITPPRLPVLVRWLGFNWGWPKAALAIRLPRPAPRQVIFPTKGLAQWPEAFNPGPTLYVQTPHSAGPVWVDPEQAPGHPFDWRPKERDGTLPDLLNADWSLFRAYCTDRAAHRDVVLELLDRGSRHAPPSG